MEQRSARIRVNGEHTQILSAIVGFLDLCYTHATPHYFCSRGDRLLLRATLAIYIEHCLPILTQPFLGDFHFNLQPRLWVLHEKLLVITDLQWEDWLYLGRIMIRY